VPEGTSFFDFFAAQWAAAAPALGLDTLVVRDGFSTWSDYVPRGGPLGYAASPDPVLNAPWFAAQKAIFRAVKQAAPDTLVLGYSSAASAVAEFRVGLMDLEAAVAEGFIDGWVDQSWAGAWQDVKGPPHCHARLDLPAAVHSRAPRRHRGRQCCARGAGAAALQALRAQRYF
jgi:hypothetical protein